MKPPSDGPDPPTERELALLLPEGRTWTASAVAAFRIDVDGQCVFGCGGRAPRFGQELSPDQGHRPDCMLVRLVSEVRRLRAGQFFAVGDSAGGETAEVMTPPAMAEEIRRLREAESAARVLLLDERGGGIDEVDEDVRAEAPLPELLQQVLDELHSEEWMVRAAEEIGQVEWGSLAGPVRTTLVLGILRRHRGAIA
jgi:hypothetical protein